MSVSSLLDQLVAGSDLTADQAGQLCTLLVDPRTTDDERVALLGALRDKGETPAEVAAFAGALRAAAVDPGIPPGGGVILDVVGTGGDGGNTLNISTATALLAAAAANGSVRVVKHGNRAISSRSGASDVLTALGLPAALEPARARALLERTGFTYLHAPHYHPAVAAVATARRMLGTRSIFNLLGPLTNPARPTAGVIGAYSPRAAEVMAEALLALGFTSAVVVHTPTEPGKGLDEATTALPYTQWRLEHGRGINLSRVSPPAATPCDIGALKGGDAREN
ncbi:MAG: anthranilate phosphoribosyltransferase, partial [Phycisphaerales bacterium]|nr:anthranilate phosphoribosyltransferase [Phycisphaerales bacterium]